MTVNLGPVDPTLQIPGLVAQNGSGLDYNPRCLRRDISPWTALGWTKTSDVMSLIEECDNISCFEWTMQGFFEEVSWAFTRPVTSPLVVIRVV